MAINIETIFDLADTEFRDMFNDFNHVHICYTECF